MKKFWNGFLDVTDDFLAYILCLMGVLLVQYVPYLAVAGKIPTDIFIDWARLGISAVIALYVILNQEKGGDPAGKRNNSPQRMINAFQAGAGWNALIGIVAVSSNHAVALVGGLLGWS